VLNKIYLPYHKLIIGLIISLIPVYFKTPIITILFVAVASLLISLNYDIKKAIIFYFILTFLLPYDFVYLSTNDTLGLIFNEYFVAGLPLYFLLPKVFIKNPYKKGKFSIQKFIFVSSLIILFYSNVLPGISYIVGFGGHKIRLIFFFNFINSIILYYFLSSIYIDKNFINLLSKYIIILGFILSFTGIVQYLFKIPIVPNFPNDDFSRLYLFSSTNPVDCIPFLLVPFVFSLSRLMNSKNISLKYVFIFLTILIAIILTWSRWAVFSCLLAVITIILLNKKFFIKALAILFIMVLISPAVITLAKNALKSGDQEERLTSSGNLYVRAYLWSLGITAILHNPVLGYGFGNSVEAMFNQETELNLVDINSGNSVSTFQKQSVHQFILDYLLSFGILFLIPLILMFFTVMKRSLELSKLNSLRDLKHIYLALFLSTLVLFVFWLQNVGPQIFYLYTFLGLVYLSQNPGDDIRLVKCK
jgi:O-antigen ligase